MTPSELKRRIEAGARAWRERVGPTWRPTEIAALILGAADGAVPMVSEAEVRRRSRIDHEAAEREHVRAERAEAAARDLRRAIAEHRTTIHNAGIVRVDSRDQLQAEAKHRADERLWTALDSPSFSGEEGTGT